MALGSVIVVLLTVIEVELLKLDLLGKRVRNASQFFLIIRVFLEFIMVTHFFLQDFLSLLTHYNTSYNIVWQQTNH